MFAMRKYFANAFSIIDFDFDFIIIIFVFVFRFNTILLYLNFEIEFF